MCQLIWMQLSISCTFSLVSNPLEASFLQRKKHHSKSASYAYMYRLSDIYCHKGHHEHHVTRRGDSSLDTLFHDSIWLATVWLVLTIIYMTYWLNSWTLDSLWLTLPDSIRPSPLVYKLLCSRETALSLSSCWIQVVLEASDWAKAVCSRNLWQNVGFSKAATRTQSLLMTQCIESLRTTKSGTVAAVKLYPRYLRSLRNLTLETTPQPVGDIKMSLLETWWQHQTGDMLCLDLLSLQGENSKSSNACSTSMLKLGIASPQSTQRMPTTTLVDRRFQGQKSELPGHPITPNWWMPWLP